MKTEALIILNKIKRSFSLNASEARVAKGSEGQTGRCLDRMLTLVDSKW